MLNYIIVLHYSISDFMKWYHNILFLWYLFIWTNKMQINTTTFWVNILQWHIINTWDHWGHWLLIMRLIFTLLVNLCLLIICSLLFWEFSEISQRWAEAHRGWYDLWNNDRNKRGHGNERWSAGKCNGVYLLCVEVVQLQHLLLHQIIPACMLWGT